MGTEATDGRRSEEQKAMKHASNVHGLSRDESISPGSGLETIQQILFGEQVRAGQEQAEIDRKETTDAMNELSSRLNDRINKLEETIENSFAAINRKLDQQTTDMKALESRSGSELSACKLALTQSIESTREELTVEMRNSLSQLEGRSMDRAKLSEIFAQVAQEVTSAKSHSDA